MRHHVLDEIGGGLAHAPSFARRAKPASLAREGDDAVVTAMVAVNADEAVLRQAAGQEVAKGAFDEPGDVGALTCVGTDKTLDATGDDLMEDRGLRLPRNMAAVVEFSGSVYELLNRCQNIEVAAGRRRDANDQWGPRTLDLDLLLFEILQVEHEALGLFLVLRDVGVTILTY